MIIWFSGTGNSQYAAKVMAEALGDESVDAGRLIKAGQPGAFTSERPWVFVAPVYAWRMPRIFSDFIENSGFSGSKEAWFVLTCGSEIGEAGKYARELCEKKGFTYRGVLQVAMPENLITLFKAPPQEKIREMIEAAGSVLASGAKRILSGEDFPPVKTGFADKLKSGPINQGFNRYFLKSTGFYATDACVSCGKCAKNCVMNNITLEDGKPQWGTACTQCMACICRCPVEAIEYGKRTRGKARYVCPEN